MTDFYDDDYDDLDTESDEDIEGGEGDADDSGNGESWALVRYTLVNKCCTTRVHVRNEGLTHAINEIIKFK